MFLQYLIRYKISHSIFILLRRLIYDFATKSLENGRSLKNLFASFSSQKPISNKILFGVALFLLHKNDELWWYYKWK